MRKRTIILTYHIKASRTSIGVKVCCNVLDKVGSIEKLHNYIIEYGHNNTIHLSMKAYYFTDLKYIRLILNQLILTKYWCPGTFLAFNNG